MIHDDHRHIGFHLTRILLVSFVAGTIATIAGVLFGLVLDLLGPLTLVFMAVVAFPMSARAYQRVFEGRAVTIRGECAVCEGGAR